MAADSEHEVHTPEATESSHEETAGHDTGIPGVDEPIAESHADAHAEAHGEPSEKKSKSAKSAGGAKKQLPLKKILIGSSVLLVGVLGLSVAFLLKGKPSAPTHGEHSAQGEDHEGHETAKHPGKAHGEVHASTEEHGGAEDHTTAEEHSDHAEGHAEEHTVEHAVHGEEHSGSSEHAEAEEHEQAEAHHAGHDAGQKHAAHDESESSNPHEVSSELEYAGRNYPAFLEPLLGPVETALIRIEDKASVIREALEENRKLRLENANLRVQAESLRLDCRVKDAAAASERNETALLSETGEKVGRTLASIGYRPPRHLDGPQLNTLGLSYLQAGEDEKAAVIFTLLSQMSEQSESSVKGQPLSRIRLLAGTAWYRLDHLELADQYFSEVLDMPETERDVRYQAQARLWRAVTAQRLGKSTKAQFWMREVLDRHPASDEAAWINPKKRGEAAEKKGEHENAHGHL